MLKYGYGSVNAHKNDKNTEHLFIVTLKATKKKKRKEKIKETSFQSGRPRVTRLPISYTPPCAKITAHPVGYKATILNRE